MDTKLNRSEFLKATGTLLAGAATANLAESYASAAERTDRVTAERGSSASQLGARPADWELGLPMWQGQLPHCPLKPSSQNRASVGLLLQSDTGHTSLNLEGIDTCT